MKLVQSTLAKLDSHYRVTHRCPAMSWSRHRSRWDQSCPTFGEGCNSDRKNLQASFLLELRRTKPAGKDKMSVSSLHKQQHANMYRRATTGILSDLALAAVVATLFVGNVGVGVVGTPWPWVAPLLRRRGRYAPSVAAPRRGRIRCRRSHIKRLIVAFHPKSV
jgi:hypothetical protein